MRVLQYVPDAALMVASPVAPNLEGLGVLSAAAIDASDKISPLLADLVIGRRDTPVTIHASRECAKALRDYMFNNSLWPDFTSIPTKKNPVLRIKTFRAGSSFQVGRYTIQSIPVSHPVESCGFIISNGQTCMAMSGDTGPTDKLWKVLNQVKDLKALLLEASFPNALQ